MVSKSSESSSGTGIIKLKSTEAFGKSATKEDIDRLEKSLADLLKLNTQHTSQVKALKEEKQANQLSINRLNENKEKWKKGDGDIVLLAEELSAIKFTQSIFT